MPTSFNYYNNMEQSPSSGPSSTQSTVLKSKFPSRPRCSAYRAKPWTLPCLPPPARRARTSTNPPAAKPSTLANARAVTWRDLNTNQSHHLECDWLLIADGKGALSSTAFPPTGDFGIKAHFQNIDGPRDAIELFGVQGHYGGLAPIENNLWNTAFSIPAPRLKTAAGDLDALFKTITQENPTLKKRFIAATRTTPWLASPLPRFPVTTRWPAHVIPLGNAAAALEPLGGEGMGLAMRSADLAANALIHWTQNNKTPLQQLPHDFNHLWGVRSLTCQTIAKIFSSPDLATAVVTLLSENTVALSALLRWTGKR